MFLNKKPILSDPIVNEKAECGTFRANVAAAWAWVQLMLLSSSQASRCAQLPTITASRGISRSYYLAWRSQRISTVELGHLQGRFVFPDSFSVKGPAFFLPGLPDQLVQQFIDQHGCALTGHALGNALSLNVAERVLSRLLVYANLVPGPLPDFWQSTILPKAKAGQLCSPSLFLLWNWMFLHVFVPYFLACHQQAWKHIQKLREQALPFNLLWFSLHLDPALHGGDCLSGREKTSCGSCCEAIRIGASLSHSFGCKLTFLKERICW